MDLDGFTPGLAAHVWELSEIVHILAYEHKCLRKGKIFEGKINKTFLVQISSNAVMLTHDSKAKNYTTFDILDVAMS